MSHPFSPPTTPNGPCAPAGWRELAQVQLAPPPDDWRQHLAQRLGERPRRIGPWAELALWGARQCLDAAGEATLPGGAIVRVASLGSAIRATEEGVTQSRSALPMPFTFMQSQPSQMLAALSRHLGWHGDASFTVCRDLSVLRALARSECGPAGVLLGCVEHDGTVQRSQWWRLLPC